MVTPWKGCLRTVASLRFLVCWLRSAVAERARASRREQEAAAEPAGAPVPARPAPLDRRPAGLARAAQRPARLGAGARETPRSGPAAVVGRPARAAASSPGR